MAIPVARVLMLLALSLACGEKGKGGASADLSVEDAGGVLPEPAELSKPAQPVPTRKAAAQVLADFAAALLAKPPGDLSGLLQIPEGLTEKQLSFFFKELRKRHVSRAGVDEILGKEFGPLAERFGEEAQGVADQATLMLDDAWAFGDRETAAILYWDGERFLVASVHRLAESQ
ncbi:MAG: hypothetical protein GY811_13105 [Myxococcales bacterium]|nr:hypothetical protein [Myxococcales bacterium]